MINDEYKCIYIHIPKCGGTAIESVFYPHAENLSDNITGKINGKPWFKHDTLQQHEKKFPEIRHYYKFAFVRNPWSHTVSMYNYMWKSLYPWPVEWRNKHVKNDILNMTFKDWVTSKWFQTPTLQSVNVARHSPDGLGRYLDYITGQTWQIDYVGKLENFQSDFNLVRTMIGLPVVTLPHINNTSSCDYTDYYDSDTKRIVGDKYAEDIEYFDYSF